MRRAARIDANQPAIVRALRKVGAFVQPLHTVGGGVPDLLVGYRGKWLTLEIKDSTQPPSKRRLTRDEKRWHMEVDGRAPVYVVISEAEALEAILRG